MGSSSAGNCYYVGTANYGFLVDAGVAVHTVKKTLKKNGLSLENIFGIFITHDHTDHIRFVDVLGEHLHIPVYATLEVHNAINRNNNIVSKLHNCQKFIRKGEMVTVNNFTFQAFPVSHDATDSMGYSITYQDKRLVIATDLGFIGKEVADHIAKANYLVIEANYDEKMLRNGAYSYFIKQRVASYTGHLCNDHTANFLADNWHDKLTHVFLCHLSQENNTPELACNTVMAALSAKNITPKLLCPLDRVEPSKMFILD
jgi:phosphoribosyl 1,2-cyclic phosphodiesterase